MSQPDYRDGETEEPPLDPATQRVQMKLRRLLLGSSLIMFAGFIAVFAAIFYKINSNDAGDAPAEYADSISIGAEAEVLQVQQTDGILLVLVREGQSTALLRFDAVSGEALGRTELVPN